MNYKNYNDYELVYMVRESDGTAKDILYNKYQPILKSISKEFYEQYKYYGYDYEDFLQEANIYFEKALIKYNENKESILYTFVNICVRRGLITFCRNITNSKRNIANYYHKNIDECSIISNNNLDDIIDNIEEEKIIREKILELPIDYSSILELRIGGFSYREISTLLSIPTSTIEYRMKKIKKELSKELCK